MLYLAFQAVRGVVIFEEMRKMRWLLFFLSMSVFSWLLSVRPRFRLETGPLISTLLVVNFAYFLFYLLFGAIGETFFGIDRFDIQQPRSDTQLLWSTTAYAVFPVVTMSIPACLCLSRGGFRDRVFVMGTLFLCIFTMLYYDSRAGLIASICILLVSVPFHRLKGLFPTTVIAGCLVATAYLSQDLIDLDALSTNLGKIFLTLATPDDLEGKTSDIDRYSHLVISVRAISESPIIFMFGYGYAVAGLVLGPYLIDFMLEYNPSYLLRMTNTNFDNVGTNMMTALIVDTGFIGISLLVTIFSILLIRGLKSKSPTRRAVILCVSLVVFWLPIIDFRDVVLFYLIIMPNGVLCSLLNNGGA